MTPSRLATRSAFRAVLVLAAAAFALGGCATPPPPPPQDDATTIAALTAQADALDRAIVRKDRAAIEANLGEDFRHIDGFGNVESRQTFVDDLVSPDLALDPYRVEDFDVRLYGDVALLSGRIRMTGRYQGKPFVSDFRYIDVYARRAGAWRVVSVQISRIPPPTPARSGE